MTLPWWCTSRPGMTTRRTVLPDERTLQSSDGLDRPELAATLRNSVSKLVLERMESPAPRYALDRT